MKFRSFVKLPRYKRFNFEPRYYDPIKEEVEKKERLAKGIHKNASKAEATKHRISDAFHARQRESQKPVYRQALIAIAITVILVISLYLVDVIMNP